MERYGIVTADHTVTFYNGWYAFLFIAYNRMFIMPYIY